MAKLSVFLAVAMTLGLSSAITNDERDAIKQAIGPIMEKCTKEFGITKEQLLDAIKAGVLETLNPCIHACFFKKIDFINEAGMFNPDGAMEKIKKSIKGEEDLKIIAAIIKTCRAVNEQNVKDGEEGCERSKMVLACLVKENGSEFFLHA